MGVIGLAPSLIRQGASDESYARGVTYYQGAVGSLVLRGEMLQAGGRQRARALTG